MSKPILKLRYKKDYCEWVVVYYENNKRVESRCYYADDKADAARTMDLMQKEIDNKFNFNLTDEEERELNFLKEYNKYLNPEGFWRLAILWKTKDNLEKIRKKNGM